LPGEHDKGLSKKSDSPLIFLEDAKPIAFGEKMETLFFLSENSRNIPLLDKTSVVERLMIKI